MKPGSIIPSDEASASPEIPLPSPEESLKSRKVIAKEDITAKEIRERMIFKNLDFKLAQAHHLILAKQELKKSGLEHTVAFVTTIRESQSYPGIISVSYDFMSESASADSDAHSSIWANRFALTSEEEWIQSSTMAGGKGDDEKKMTVDTFVNYGNKTVLGLLKLIKAEMVSNQMADHSNFKSRIKPFLEKQFPGMPASSVNVIFYLRVAKAKAKVKEEIKRISPYITPGQIQPSSLQVQVASSAVEQSELIRLDDLIADFEQIVTEEETLIAGLSRLFPEVAIHRSSSKEVFDFLKESKSGALDSVFTQKNRTACFYVSGGQLFLMCLRDAATSAYSTFQDQFERFCIEIEKPSGKMLVKHGHSIFPAELFNAAFLESRGILLISANKQLYQPKFIDSAAPLFWHSSESLSLSSEVDSCTPGFSIYLPERLFQLQSSILEKECKKRQFSYQSIEYNASAAKRSEIIEKLANFFAQQADNKEEITLHLHGHGGAGLSNISSNHGAVVLTVDQLSTIIDLAFNLAKSRKELQFKLNIWLHSCSAGQSSEASDSLMQQLANRLEDSSSPLCHYPWTVQGLAVTAWTFAADPLSFLKGGRNLKTVSNRNYNEISILEKEIEAQQKLISSALEDKKPQEFKTLEEARDFLKQEMALIQLKITYDQQINTLLEKVEALKRTEKSEKNHRRLITLEQTLNEYKKKTEALYQKKAAYLEKVAELILRWEDYQKDLDRIHQIEEIQSLLNRVTEAEGPTTPFYACYLVAVQAKIKQLLAPRLDAIKAQIPLALASEIKAESLTEFLPILNVKISQLNINEKNCIVCAKTLPIIQKHLEILKSQLMTLPKVPHQTMILLVIDEILVDLTDKISVAIDTHNFIEMINQAGAAVMDADPADSDRKKSRPVIIQNITLEQKHLIQLKGKCFNGIEFKDCKITGSLAHWNLAGATLTNCEISDNKQWIGIIFDEKTQLDWRRYGQNIIEVNCSHIDFYQTEKTGFEIKGSEKKPTHQDYLNNLLETLKNKNVVITQETALTILKNIGTSFNIQSSPEELLIYCKKAACQAITVLRNYLTPETAFGIVHTLMTEGKRPGSPYNYIFHQRFSFTIRRYLQSPSYGSTETSDFIFKTLEELKQAAMPQRKYAPR